MIVYNIPYRAMIDINELNVSAAQIAQYNPALDKR